MSVQYYFNKPVRIGDLKKIGLTVEDCRQYHQHPFVITNEIGDGVAISEIITNDSVYEDEWIIQELEGRCSVGGATVVLEICDKLGCKFITDEDRTRMCYENDFEITEETFNERTEEFRKMLNEESK